MTHKCEYCDKVITSGQQADGITCTCKDNPETCEMSVRVVCDEGLCQLKFKVDWYQIELQKANGDIAKLKAINNQFRIANIGSIAAERLVKDGTLDIIGIKSFTSRQRLTWDEIPVDTGYILMCLHEEFAKQWAAFLNEKQVKVQIKKELIDKTHKRINEAQKIREGKSVSVNGEVKDKKKTSRANLTPFEKIVFHNMSQLKMSQTQAIDFAHSMGAVGEVRPETKFE